MRNGIWALGFLAAAGTATAEDSLSDPALLHDSSDYAAQAYYRFSFGAIGSVPSRHRLGFTMVNERAHAQGAPALFKAELNSGGLPQVALNGVNITQVLLAARQTSEPSQQGETGEQSEDRRKGSGWFGGDGLLGGLTTGEAITVIAAIVIVGFGTYEATQDDPPATGAGP